MPLVQELGVTPANEKAFRVPTGNATSGVGVVRHNPNESLGVAARTIRPGNNMVGIPLGAAGAWSVGESDIAFDQSVEREMEVGNAGCDW